MATNDPNQVWWKPRHVQLQEQRAQPSGPQPAQAQFPGMGERRAPSLPPIQHAEQQQLPFQGTMSVRKPGAPTFKQTGLGKFFNPRNVNGEQFNKPEVQHQLQNMARAHTRSQYFRRAGFGAALRYTLDMEQVPSHVQDYLNARSNPRNVTGIHPGPMHSYYSPGKDVDPEA